MSIDNKHKILIKIFTKY